MYLIPYFNAYNELIITLKSLSENIDVYIVDDGSSDKLENLLDVNLYDFKIKIITLLENVGIERALNAGLDELYGKYDYIARLDCGDLSSPGRIKKQLEVITSSGAVLLGGAARYVDEEYNELFINTLPCDDTEIRKKMYLNNLFIHPSVIMNLEAIKNVGGYPLGFEAAEDYALFFKLLNYGEVANIADVVIEYVVSSQSISATKRKKQIKSRLKVVIDNFDFTPMCILGILRAVLTLMLPRSLTMTLRKYLKAY